MIKFCNHIKNIGFEYWQYYARMKKNTEKNAHESRLHIEFPNAPKNEIFFSKLLT